jgi:hypothetical protein
MRRLNWTPVIVPNAPRAEDGEAHDGEIPSAAHPNSALTEDRRVDIRFTVAVAVALGLPALIGAGVYLAATILLRLS